MSPFSLEAKPDARQWTIIVNKISSENTLHIKDKSCKTEHISEALQSLFFPHNVSPYYTQSYLPSFLTTSTW